jgi:hypothetical protein
VLQEVVTEDGSRTELQLQAGAADEGAGSSSGSYVVRDDATVMQQVSCSLGLLDWQQFPALPVPSMQTHPATNACSRMKQPQCSSMIRCRGVAEQYHMSRLKPFEDAKKRSQAFLAGQACRCMVALLAAGWQADAALFVGLFVCLPLDL